MLVANINIQYEERIVFKDFNIEIKENTITCITGKSGVGKTTLINYISDILLADNIRFSYVFQEDRLVPWLSVYDNLKLAAANDIAKAKIHSRISEILSIVDLQDADKLFPGQLSGGMRQRVNIARAFIRNDQIILMDEPFKSIDNLRKYKIMNYIKNLTNTTIVIVTHNKEEVEFLNADTYILEGKPIQYAKKVDIKNITNKF